MQVFNENVKFWNDYSMNDRLSTLVLDDDPVYLRLAASRLKEDFIVFTALSPSVALDLLIKERIDVLICDFNLPEMNGLEVVKKVKRICPDTDVIMISGSIEDEYIVEAFDSGVIDFLQKPVEYKALKISIERAKSFVSLRKKNIEIKKYNSFLRQKFTNENSIGFDYRSESMQQVKSVVEELAKDDSISVVVTGEIGLCKDSFARRIHDLSVRERNHFEAVDMMSVSDSLFEKKFFGCCNEIAEKYPNDEFGWFEVAKGGTLFLDEIVEMSIYQQAKLNSVLQNMTYPKIGSRKYKIFDVRLISACSASLDDLRLKKNFRMDLLQKLNGYELYIPPLRDRQEDIPLLMNHFIRHYSVKMRKSIHRFDPYTEGRLMEYTYPGNIWELSNLIERAVILCQGDTLNLDHFPHFESEKEIQMPLAASFDLALIEREVIIRALKECDYNKSQAAKLLNLNWNALHRRLQKFNITFPELECDL